MNMAPILQLIVSSCEMQQLPIISQWLHNAQPTADGSRPWVAHGNAKSCVEGGKQGSRITHMASQIPWYDYRVWRQLQL